MNGVVKCVNIGANLIWIQPIAGSNAVLNDGDVGPFIFNHCLPHGKMPHMTLVIYIQEEVQLRYDV